MKDEALVQSFWERDETAIAKAREQYGDYCYAIAGNVLESREDCEECLNEAMLAAWNSIPPQRPNNLKTYLGKLIREIAVDHLRKNHAQKRIPRGALLPLDELEELVGENAVSDSIEEAELSTLISGFLRSLKETERNVFLRRYWYYDPVNEICRRYGFGKSNVLMRLKRTRERLAECLKKEGYFL